jgi:hypothetical protein
MSRSVDRTIMDRKLIFTVSFIAALLVLVILRNNGWRLPWPSWASGSISSASTAPDDAIYAMLDAARAGDTRAYLASFSGALHEQLLQVVKEQSEASFAAYLRSQNAAYQGVAVSVTDRPSDIEAQVRVEYIYSNRNEVQSMYLRREAARWRIVKVAGSEQVKTLVPYGTAVTE